MSLPQFIDEPVLVQVRLPPAGGVRPVAFAWRERTRVIVDIGRQWDETSDGVGWRCYLVRTANRETFELRFAAATGAWLLHRAWLRRDRQAV
ncbi:MAG: hypothetical protein QG637_298 [Chloroflexota bacterium]|nr:hypothetical protein [Chloroflexota bacterium]